MKKGYSRAPRRARRLFTRRRNHRTLGHFDQLEPRCLLSASGFDDSLDPHHDHDHDHPCSDAERDAVGYEYHALTHLPSAEMGTVAGAATDSGNLWDAFDASKTFLLHSNPGARHTIYLDFDGHRTSGTPWNSSFQGGADIVTPAYDSDGNPLAFSNNELQTIYRIWLRVAEDFAPFDVNVTTQDPGTAALIKSGSSDTHWGVRVVVGGSSSDWLGSSAGGVAYLDSFNWSSDTPAFVFENELGNGHEKYTAEAISHEAGHTLGLRHDGTSTSGYYTGHGSGATGWAPIMGAGYYREVTQWSRGEYAGASNSEDDLSIITTRNGFGYRADDHGDSDATATSLTSTGGSFQDTGIIERSDDVDVFSFYAGTGELDLTLSPAQRGANLDLLAQLYDASHVLIASANPADLLTAGLNSTVSAGRYFLHVSGVGRAGTSGYSDYASLGGYRLQGQVTAGVEPAVLDITELDAEKAEGTSGSTPFTFVVTRSGDASSAVSAAWSVKTTASVSASAADFQGGILPSGTVTFAAGETSQTITVLVQGDSEVELNESFVVTLRDVAGAEVGDDTAVGLIMNDDTQAQPGIRVTAIHGYTTSEDRTRARFSVVLESAPTSSVTIRIRTLDNSEGFANKAKLTFTASNWDVPQYFMVRGRDDRLLDGDIGYTIKLVRARSDDPNYHGLKPVDLRMTNLDNESPAASNSFNNRWRGATLESPSDVDATPLEDIAAPNAMQAAKIPLQHLFASLRPSSSAPRSADTPAVSTDSSWTARVDALLGQRQQHQPLQVELESALEELVTPAL